ncbi:MULTISPECIES: hypothetical protein [Klebsiella pneumoniae complex]|nr:hypothetical protein [Klebsiella variicola]
MEEEIKYNIEVDCSTLESAAKEIRALKVFWQLCLFALIRI